MRLKVTDTLDKLSLPTQVANALRRGGYCSYLDLQCETYSSLLKIRGIGKDALAQIIKACNERGIELVDDLTANRSKRSSSRFKIVRLTNGERSIDFAVLDTLKQELYFGAMPVSESEKRGFFIEEVI